VLGTTTLPEDIASLAQLDEQGLEKVRQGLRERLAATQPKVTPAMLNREFESLRKAIDIHRNLATIRGLGRRVLYIPCDVRDLKGLSDALAQAREALGPVTAIIHAAGIDKSHLIERKSVEEFHDVLTVKAEGALNLMHVCRNDPLRLVVAFSSISGRFGNAAQLDYAAANSFLSDWVKMLHRARQGVHTLSLVWSGWKDVGMAWRNELVRDRSEEMGLNLIEVREGVAAFMQEIENHTADREIILHKGLGGFLAGGMAITDLSQFPLIDRVVKREGRVTRAYRAFSVRRDALVDQHRLGKVPILPAVAYSELAAEFYALQARAKPHYVLRDLAFSSPFKLFREQPRELFIDGVPVNDRAWQIEIKSAFRPPTSDEAQLVVHSRATVSDELDDYADMDPRTWPLEADGSQLLTPQESLLLIGDSAPEQHIIVGPLYNDAVRDATGKEPVLIYPSGIVYPTYFPQEQLVNAKYPLQTLLTNPCLLDSIYQACAVYLMVSRNRVYLPWEVGELGIVSVPRAPGLFRTYAQVVREWDDVVEFNVSMVDGEGQVRSFGRHTRFRRINL
jgi:NAD(P)-dependent dehydrogenase (short-subunit alcohol dehydrogenase family)